MPDVSVIIVSMNKPELLRVCLSGIREHTAVSYETFVVAYLYEAENLRAMKEEFPWVTFIESNEVRGFSENNNLALRLASGRFCYVVNDDTEACSDVIGKLVDDFALLPPDAAIVSPRILNEDGSLQLCGRPPFSAVQYVLERFHLYSEPKDDTAGKEPVAPGVFRTSNITGACFLIRRDIFEGMGWFDERFFFTPEDFALSTNLRRKGFGVYVDSDITITHKWHKTASAIIQATHPAAMRGTIMFFADGSDLRYLAIALPTWLAQTVKRIKAAAVCACAPTPQRRIMLRSYRNETRSIFTHRSTKEIFLKYFRDKSNKVQNHVSEQVIEANT